MVLMGFPRPFSISRPRKWLSALEMNLEAGEEEATQEAAKRDLSEVENSTNIWRN